MYWQRFGLIALILISSVCLQGCLKPKSASTASAVTDTAKVVSASALQRIQSVLETLQSQKKVRFSVRIDKDLVETPALAAEKSVWLEIALRERRVRFVYSPDLKPYFSSAFVTRVTNFDTYVSDHNQSLSSAVLLVVKMAASRILNSEMLTEKLLDDATLQKALRETASSKHDQFAELASKLTREDPFQAFSLYARYIAHPSKHAVGFTEETTARLEDGSVKLDFEQLRLEVNCANQIAVVNPERTKAVLFFDTKCTSAPPIFFQFERPNWNIDYMARERLIGFMKNGDWRIKTVPAEFKFAFDIFELDATGRIHDTSESLRYFKAQARSFTDGKR